MPRRHTRRAALAVAVAATIPVASAPLWPAASAAGKLRCQTVVQIGDSTSVATDDDSLLSDPADRLTARYKAVGASTVILDATGGRSIKERVNGQPSAAEGVDTLLGKGTKGCWVIAMGVNDVGNIAAGSNTDAVTRINTIMDKLKGQDVLWPTVATNNPSQEYYSSANMAKFNDALHAAEARYPNLKVYDFKPTPSMFYDDGIHYSAEGTAARNKQFADALAQAYPADAPATAPTPAPSPAPSAPPETTATSTAPEPSDAPSSAPSDTAKTVCAPNGGGSNPDTAAVTSTVREAVSAATSAGEELQVAIGGAANPAPVITDGQTRTVKAAALSSAITATPTGVNLTNMSARDGAQTLMTLCMAAARGNTAARTTLSKLQRADSPFLADKNTPAAGVFEASEGTRYDVGVLGSGSYWFAISIIARADSPAAATSRVNALITQLRTQLS